MKDLSIQRRMILVGVVLVVATLACSAPFAQQTASGTATQAVAEAVTTEPPGSIEVVTQASTEAATQPPGAATATTPPAAAPTATATVCGYNSTFVTDLTIPDGTPEQIGATFTKTWRIKNTGCQTWPNGTTLIFLTGGGSNQMSGPASVPVPQTAPNGTQDVSVTLTAPGPEGNYQGNWRLRTPDGIQFGQQIYVKITTTNPPPPPAAPTATHVPLVLVTPPVLILALDFTINGYAGSWSCTSSGHTVYKYSAQITNSGAVPLESDTWTLQSPVGTVVGSATFDAPFQSVPASGNCSDAGLQGDTLAVGASAWVSGQWIDTPIPAGQASVLVLKMCSANGAGGTCVSRHMNFAP